MPIPDLRALSPAEPTRRDVGVELMLGLGPEDVVLQVEPGARRVDLQPWLLDAVAVRIACLGYRDATPHPWDWENVLTLLEPGEELLYVLDHQAAGARGPGAVELWLAIRFPPQSEVDVGSLERREKRARVVIAQLQREAFPGSEVSWLDPAELLQRLCASTGPSERCVVVTGMPSPRGLQEGDRDLDRGAATLRHPSLNAVVGALEELGGDYRIAFAVQRLGNPELEIELARKTELYDRVHPRVGRNLREGQNWAAQWSESQSQSEASGASSERVAGANKGSALNFAPAGVAAGAGVGLMVAGAPAAVAGAALGALVGMVGPSRGRSLSAAAGRSWTHTDTAGSTAGGSHGASLDATAEHINSLLRLADRSLERTIDALHEAIGTGAYRWAAFAFAEGQNVDIVGRSLMGVLAGARTKDRPLVRFEVKGEGDRLLASRSPAMELVAEAAVVLSLRRVCDALLLPSTEVPGLRLRRNVFLGRNIEATPDAYGTIELGPDAFSAIGPPNTQSRIHLPGGDLFRHVLVAGATGSGKTTRVVEIVNRLTLPELSVVVFETAKRTYRGRLQRRDRPAPLVYVLGSSASFHPADRFRPLRLNPFYFELGTSLKRHIAVLADALAELMPTEAMIGPLLRRAVERCYAERGWDIEDGAPVVGRGAPTWPTVVDLVVQVRRLAAELTYGAEVNANYRGALESRAGLFLDATFQDIFGYDGDRSIDQLIPAGCDAILEVEDLPPSDVDIRAFVMTLLLSRLRSVQGSRLRGGSQDPPLRQAEDKPRRWLVVVEEAHNVLERQFEQRRPSDESNAGRTLLRTVVRLLQEGREMGIGLMVVDQAPTRLARDVISNTGTKIVLRLEDADEMAEIGRAMGLDAEAWQKLGYLQVGEAVIKTPSMDRPARSSGYTPAELSPRPPSEGPQGAGWSPSFSLLAERWRPVLQGSGAEPTADWVEGLRAEAGGNLRLALFAGLRSLLMEGGLSPRDAPELRALLACSDPSAAEVGAAARGLWSGLVAAHYAEELAGVASALCGALAPSPAWRRRSFSADGIALACHVLAQAGLGSEEAWRWALTQARLHHRAPRAQALLCQLAEGGPGLDRTAAPRLLLSMTPALRAWRPADPPPAPSVLLASIGVELHAILLADGLDPAAGGPSGADLLFAEIEARLAAQVAARWGPVYASQMHELLARLSRMP